MGTLQPHSTILLLSDSHTQTTCCGSHCTVAFTPALVKSLSLHQALSLCPRGFGGFTGYQLFLLVASLKTPLLLQSTPTLLQFQVSSYPCTAATHMHSLCLLVSVHPRARHRPPQVFKISAGTTAMAIWLLRLSCPQTRHRW